LLIRNGVTVSPQLDSFSVNKTKRQSAPQNAHSSEKHGCDATIEPIAQIDLPVIRVCFECLNHFVVSHTMTVHTNTVMAIIHEKALMVGCLSWRFDLTARRISAETIASAA
jgi:hypothetical protein